MPVRRETPMIKSHAGDKSEIKMSAAIKFAEGGIAPLDPPAGLTAFTAAAGIAIRTGGLIIRKKPGERRLH
jgi:hypothetical protein